MSARSKDALKKLSPLALGLLLGEIEMGQVRFRKKKYTRLILELFDRYGVIILYKR
jgi:hypothetical protein